MPFDAVQLRSTSVVAVEALGHDSLGRPRHEPKRPRPVRHLEAEAIRLGLAERLVVDRGVRPPEQRGQPAVGEPQPEHDRTLVLDLHRVDRVPVPELARRKFEAQVLERRDDGLRVTGGPGMEARAGLQPQPPLEAVVGHVPGLGEARVRSPVRALHHEQLVDRQVAGVDVRAGRVEPRELVVEGLAEDHGLMGDRKLWWRRGRQRPSLRLRSSARPYLGYGRATSVVSGDGTRPPSGGATVSDQFPINHLGLPRGSPR